MNYIKLSLNLKKNKYRFFHKNSVKDNIPLKLPELKVAHWAIERTNAIKFLGILLDDNITWKNHIYSVEKKLAKNIGLLYRAKYLLDESFLKTMYFSYIYSYLNHANIDYLLSLKTRGANCFNQEKLIHSRPLLRSLSTLNVYQINSYQHFNFMHKVGNNVASLIFNDMFKKS